ncbi:uncharacterized protein B0H18DRAFT_1126900 [Fomitopsis serialis]|uniref:uncharacterized protein n=1 Tax=Fomitopsis serialis TaxID=139415 RepID=UPI002008A91C|nr:uncharacterized protein B0H18DRAFT_1126900 [Neoantrodia serialis]KAH9912663.1 hypothetical protein B0H18DRAFT_1126900 [Neoantrodia serialis]
MAPTSFWQKRDIVILADNLQDWKDAEGDDERQEELVKNTIERLQELREYAFDRETRELVVKWYTDQREEREKLRKEMFKLGKDVSWQTVAAREREGDLADIIADLGQGREKDPKVYLSLYQTARSKLCKGISKKEEEDYRATADLWNRTEWPPDLQQKTLLRHGTDMVLDFQRIMYRKTGLRTFTLGFVKASNGRPGIVEFDFNDQLPINGEEGTEPQRFIDAYPDFKRGHTYEMWKKYAEDVMDGDGFPADGQLGAAQLIANLDWELDEDRYPLLPDADHECFAKTDTKRAVLGTFVRMTYRRYTGRPKAKVPWQSLSEESDTFIDEAFLPAGHVLSDPNKMRVGDLDAILKHWRERQDDQGSLLVFRFKAWRNSNREVVVIDESNEERYSDDESSSSDEEPPPKRAPAGRPPAPARRRKRSPTPDSDDAEAEFFQGGDIDQSYNSLFEDPAGSDDDDQEPSPPRLTKADKGKARANAASPSRPASPPRGPSNATTNQADRPAKPAKDVSQKPTSATAKKTTFRPAFPPGTGPGRGSNTTGESKGTKDKSASKPNTTGPSAEPAAVQKATARPKPRPRRQPAAEPDPTEDAAEAPPDERRKARRSDKDQTTGARPAKPKPVPRHKVPKPAADADGAEGAPANESKDTPARGGKPARPKPVPRRKVAEPPADADGADSAPGNESKAAPPKGKAKPPATKETAPKGAKPAAASSKQAGSSRRALVPAESDADDDEVQIVGHTKKVVPVRSPSDPDYDSPVTVENTRLARRAYLLSMTSEDGTRGMVEATEHLPEKGGWRSSTRWDWARWDYPRETCSNVIHTKPNVLSQFRRWLTLMEGSLAENTIGQDDALLVALAILSVIRDIETKVDHRSDDEIPQYVLESQMGEKVVVELVKHCEALAQLFVNIAAYAQRKRKAGPDDISAIGARVKRHRGEDSASPAKQKKPAKAGPSKPGPKGRGK